MKPDTNEGISDELLQRYFDGELSTEERASVEARLDGAAQQRLEALAELRGVLRVELTHEPPALDFSSTFDAIARAAATAPVSRRRRLLPMSAAGGLMAAAAALFLFLRPVGPDPTPTTTQSAASVETLESQGALASVFQVANGSDHATVIWTDATPMPQGELP